MTTEAPTTNPHQPEIAAHHWNCTAPECRYQMHVYPIRAMDPAEHGTYWQGIWDGTHAAQFGPGRAPDIAIEWEISALCSVCPDGIGEVIVNDPESVICKECKTTWDMDGEQGELDQ